MKTFEWKSAPDVASAARSGSGTVADAMAARDGKPRADTVVLKAGGIDLLDLMKEGLLEPQRIVNLRGIPALGGMVEQPDGGLRIGAMASLAQIASHAAVRARYAALAQAAEGSASPQIRGVATIGGNLLQRPRCWYFRSSHHPCARKGGTTCFAFSGDNRYHAVFGHEGCAIVHPSTAATALVAFDASVEISSAARGTRAMPLESFLVGPGTDIHRENVLQAGEILTAVLLAPSRPAIRSAHLRQGELDSFDWPLCDVAVVLDRDEGGTCRRASVVLGAAAPVPHRARAAQDALGGKRISEEVARIAAAAALAGAAPLSGNAYKLPIFETLVERAILSAARSA